MFGLVAAAASVVALCSCGFSRDEPTGPAEADVAASVQARLDRQWELSDLEGIIVRPETTFERIVSPNEWGDVMSECMHEAGIHGWGYSAASGLFLEGGRASASDQLAFYWCFASFPTVDLLSEQQLDYIYDYYAHWLTPCLEAHGYNVMNAPTRESFREAPPSRGRWNPYASLEEYPRSLAASARLRAACAPTLPGIVGWSEGRE